jgi:PAS domain S-box-containing protein
VFTDITEFKEITNHLRQSQADLEAILDNLPARISSFNVDGRNRFANCTAERRMGFASDGAKGRTVREIMGDAWYADYKSHVEGALAGQRQRFRTLERQPDGSTRYSQVEYVPASADSGEAGFYSLAVDITEQEQSHERIRHLVQRMATVREDERRVIAQTLHEGIAQELFAVKLGLANLTAAGNLAPSGQLCSGLASAIDNCMAEIRQIANDLRPCGMPHSSVATTIREYARQFAAMCGLSIRVSELQSFPELDEPKRLAFFRAAQEALTNVARHARATQIDIVLRADGPLLTMDVLDDGVGIEDTAIGKSGSLGLLGIRERFVSIHGALTVRRNQGAGTTFSVSLPAPQKPHAVNHVRNQSGTGAR